MPSLPKVQTPANSADSPASPGTGEFIELGGTIAKFDSHSGSKSRSTSDAFNKNERRERSKIVDIAIKMLNAGAGFDKIKKILPISEAELSLLKQSQEI